MQRERSLRISGMLVTTRVRAGQRASRCFGDDVLSGACLADSRRVLVGIYGVI